LGLLPVGTDVQVVPTADVDADDADDASEEPGGAGAN
jgi:hypothetical protein